MDFEQSIQNSQKTSVTKWSWLSCYWCSSVLAALYPLLYSLPPSLYLLLYSLLFSLTSTFYSLPFTLLSTQLSTLYSTWSYLLSTLYSTLYPLLSSLTSTFHFLASTPLNQSLQYFLPFTLYSSWECGVVKNGAFGTVGKNNLRMWPGLWGQPEILRWICKKEQPES